MIKKKLMYRDPRWSKAKIWLSANLGFHHRLWPIPSGCKMQEGEASQRSFKECSCKQTKEPTSCDTFSLGSCDNFYEEWIIGTDQQTNDSTHDQTSNSLFFVGTVGYCLYNVKICQHMSTKHHWAVFQRKADKTQVSSFQALFPQRCSSDQFRRSLVCGLYIYMYIYTHDMHITCLKNQPLIGRKLEKTKGTIHGSPKRTWQEQLVRSNGSWDPGSPATSTGLQGLRWQVRGA